eukprot:3559392-Pyramimonas_sp.AAC.1
MRRICVSWGPLGRPSGSLEACWRLLGLSGGHLGRLQTIFRQLGASWTVWGASGTLWGTLPGVSRVSAG